MLALSLPLTGAAGGDDHVQPPPVQDSRLVPQQAERHQGRQDLTGGCAVLDAGDARPF